MGVWEAFAGRKNLSKVLQGEGLRRVEGWGTEGGTRGALPLGGGSTLCSTHNRKQVALYLGTRNYLVLQEF